MKILKAKFVGIDSNSHNLIYSLGDSSILLKKYGLRSGDIIKVLIQE